jgi:dihydrofolate synthase/folylpolyglutamate synthase
MAFEQYYKAIEYVESFIKGPAEPLEPRSPEEIAEQRERRLPRMAFFLGLLGNPHNQFKSIHVGGTSGKGSVTTLVGAILRAAGYKVGVHTTPYLQTPIEKMEINGVYISPQELVELVNWIKPLAQRADAESPYGPLAYGQIWVALTMAYFAQKEVAFAAIEVGMGGRYDYTNILKPLVSIITNVGFDHTRVLGETLPEIAYHKAGIAKESTPLVTSATQPEVLAIIEEECQKKKAKLIRVGREINYVAKSVTQAGGIFDYIGEEAQYRDLQVSLLGNHQIINATVAVGAIEALKYSSIYIPEEAIRRGLSGARFAGRLEIMQTNPTVVLDGAHNPEKVQKLKEALLKLFTYERLILVLGVLASKESAQIVEELAPLADLVITTAPDVIGKPATDPEELAAQIRALGKEAICEPKGALAIERALALARPGDLVCVTGSLYLLGEIREHWVKQEEMLEAAAR